MKKYLLFFLPSSLSLLTTPIIFHPSPLSPSLDIISCSPLLPLSSLLSSISLSLYLSFSPSGWRRAAWRSRAALPPPSPSQQCVCRPMRRRQEAFRARPTDGGGSVWRARARAAADSRSMAVSGRLPQAWWPTGSFLRHNGQRQASSAWIRRRAASGWSTLAWIRWRAMSG